MSETEDAGRQWWERTWAEREDALWSAFGPSQPPGWPEGHVVGFSREEVPLPGACCYVFPPKAGDPNGTPAPRDHWLYVTHGATQWIDRESMDRARARGNNASGSGVEFGIVVDAAASWAPALLRRIVSIDHAARSAGRRPFERGDRIPFYFESLGAPLGEGHTHWAIGGLDGPDVPPADATRSLLFWPYLSPFGTFGTETGSFEVRIATLITGPELALAQETSSCHLLMLLAWAGVGQRSRPGRPSVTELTDWEPMWRDIASLPFEETTEALRRMARGGVARG